MLNIYSIGGLALKIFQKNFNQNKICLQLTSQIITNLKLAYYGGRCEIFANEFRSNRKIRHFDFEGMYHSCLTGAFPIDKFEFIEDIQTIDKPGFYFIEIEYESHIPILPIKQDKLLFPKGRIKGLYWFEEINLIFKYYIPKQFKIHYAWITHSYIPCFEQFAQTFQQLKLIFPKKIIKNVINSFYGRLGLSDDLKITTLGFSYEKKHYTEFLEINNFFLKNNIITQSKKLKANIAIAAIIAARARIKLYESIMYFNQMTDTQVLYVDTDSLIISFPNTTLIDNKQHIHKISFDLTKEETMIQDAIFIAPKTYALKLINNKEIIKLKGINKHTLTFDQIKFAFLQNSPLKLQKTSLLQNGLEFKLVTENINLSTTNYNKRIWNKDYTTEPLYFKQF